MDKAEARQLQSELAAAADAIFQAHGLKAVKGRASFDVGMFRFTVEAHSTDSALDPKVSDWNKYAQMYGLPVDALGKSIVVGRQQYKIDGLVLSRRKYPVAVTQFATGKSMLITVAAAKAALA